jgi:hypothetical protein
MQSVGIDEVEYGTVEGIRVGLAGEGIVAIQFHVSLESVQHCTSLRPHNSVSCSYSLISGFHVSAYNCIMRDGYSLYYR